MHKILTIYEILWECLKGVQVIDLARCCVVNRAWFNVASAIMWRSVADLTWFEAILAHVESPTSVSSIVVWHSGALTIL
jgi:hypothetical protein